MFTKDDLDFISEAISHRLEWYRSEKNQTNEVEDKISAFVAILEKIADASNAIPGKTPDTQTKQFSQKSSILVVDDTRAMRQIICAMLRDEGFNKIHEVENGNAAWKMINNSPQLCELIICDWNMPSMSGIDLLQLIRESDKHMDIPFIMVTAKDDLKHLEEAIKAGVNDYLVKPFSQLTFKNKLQKIIKGS